MDDTMLLFLEIIKESLPKSLIDEASYERMSVIAGQLPKELSTFWGFEVRMGIPEARADILYSIDNKSEGQRFLINGLPSAAAPLSAQHSAWSTLHEFARLWGEPGHPCHAHFRNLWLEFDASDTVSFPDAARIIDYPNVFLGPDNEISDRKALDDFIQNALNVITDKKNRFGKTRSFIESLPPGAHLFQVGLMLPRPTDALRVCVDHITPAAIPAWLAAINWDGDFDALNELLARLDPITQVIAVDLDLTPDGPAGKIGLECYMDWLTDDASQWKLFLEAIAHLDLCLPEKRDGLLAYPGISSIPGNSHASQDGVFHHDIYRKIHHVKLSFQDAKAFEAKAYLAVSHPSTNLQDFHGWLS